LTPLKTAVAAGHSPHEHSTHQHPALNDLGGEAEPSPPSLLPATSGGLTRALIAGGGGGGKGGGEGTRAAAVAEVPAAVQVSAKSLSQVGGS
jgi:hypothetical protein